MISRPPALEWTRTPLAVRERVRAARRSAPLRYGAALVAVAAALALTRVVQPARAPYDQSFFVVAVLGVAWFGGARPGFVATLASSFAARYYLGDPPGAWTAVTAADAFHLVVFGIVAGGVSYLADSQQRALRRARDFGERSAAAAALLEAQREEYRRLIETANEGVWTSDTLGRTTYVNARMAEMLGYAPDEMLGRPIFDFMDAAERARAEARLERRNRGLAAEHDTRFVRSDGTELWTRATTNPIRDPGGRIIGSLGMFADVTERRRAEAHLAFLADASETLAASLDYEVTLDSVVRLAVGELADTCTADLVDGAGEGMARVAAHSVDPAVPALLAELERRAPTRLDAARGRGAVARTGTPLIAASPAGDALGLAAASPEHLAILHSLDLRSGMVVPLTVAGRVLGTLTFLRHGPARVASPRAAYDGADLALAGDLARRAAVAIDNARLLRASEEAEGRAEFLAAATTVLADGLAQDERLAQLADVVVPALADFCAVDAVTDDGALRCVAVAHRERALEPRLERAARHHPPPLATGPFAEALGSHEPQLVARVPDAWASGSDARHRALVGELRAHSLMVVPLVARGRTLGVITLARAATPPRPFAPADLDFAGELARRAALAVDNARLYEAEQEARRAAERAGARAQFLSEASALLSSSLEEEAALGAVSRLAVPRLADWCALDVQDDDGTLRRLAVAHADPALAEAARALGQDGPARVVRSGRAVAVRDVESALAAEPRDGDDAPASLRLAHALGLRSYLCAPLVARGRVLGAVTLATAAQSGRLFDDDDAALAEDLGRRAAVALDNARLYRVAQVANRAKSDFLATMSHELRTPLNAIGGYAQLMEMGLRGPVTGPQLEDLSRIGRAQRHLLSLIENVLSFAQIEAARVRYDVRPHRLHALVGDLDALVGPQLEAKHLAYDYRPGAGDLTVLADAERAQQVVLNLLGNAVKYTPAGGAVTVSCGSDGAGQGLVRVHDTGPGIPADKLEMIFEPFTQVDGGLTRTAEGTGLGLAIGRELARAMGGELTVESTVGVGSTFTLALPLAAAHRATLR